MYPLKEIQRLSSITLFVLTIFWVYISLGGLRFKPIRTSDGVNTGVIFNWHPILMVLTYSVLMSEGILTYKYPLFSSWNRQQTKYFHLGLQCSGAVLSAFSLVAVFNSHNFASPPIPNLYSAHSYLGVATSFAFYTQVIFGSIIFLVKGVKRQYKAQYQSFHTITGLMTSVLAATTITAGFVEKATFLSMGEPYKSNKYAAGLIFPGILVLLTVFTTIHTLIPHLQITELEAQKRRPTLDLSNVDETSSLVQEYNR